MAGAFLVSDFGLLVMMLRAFSRDLPCCSDRTDFLFLGSWEGPPRQCWDVMGSMRNGG